MLEGSFPPPEEIRVSSLMVLIPIAFGLVLLAALVVTVIAVARNQRTPAPAESGAQTWRTAVPWLLALVVLVLVLLGAYALTR